MLRRSVRRLLGYTPVNPDTSPMVMYSNYHWHYNLPQGMERPHNVNRRLPAPFQSMHQNVNRYRGVWISIDGSPHWSLTGTSSYHYNDHHHSSNRNSTTGRTMTGGGVSSSSSRRRSALMAPMMPLAYQVALSPYLQKLPHGRSVPSTPVEEAVADFETLMSPWLARQLEPATSSAPALSSASVLLLEEQANVMDLWLSKVIQHCALARAGDVAMQLWEKYAAPRYMPKETEGNSDASDSHSHRRPPPLPLVKAILFACSKSDHAGWRAIFEQCLKTGWNYTPYFETAQWSYLLKSIGRQGDERGVRLVLEEMLDVKADLDRVEARSIVFALNAVKDKEIYNYVKQYLFHFGERKVKFLRITYSDLRGHGAGKLRLPLNPAENDEMYYHVCWHESIRLPRTFSPRQLYFDYTPSSIVGGAQDPNAKIDDIVRDKIEKWKGEGLLPEDYVHEDRVYDRATAFKNVARQEKWKRMPRIVKSRRFGYTGD